MCTYTAHRRLSSPRDRPGDISQRIKRICDHGGNVNGAHFGVRVPAVDQPRIISGKVSRSRLEAEQDMSGAI